MSKYALTTQMSFLGGAAVFFTKAREGRCYPLGQEKRHVVDGEVVGGGGAPAYFQDHRWATTEQQYAAGMVNQTHFDAPDGWLLDPSCLPQEALEVWPNLNRRAKQLLCLNLISGMDPVQAVAEIPKESIAPKKAETPPAAAEAIKCPVCGLQPEGQADPQAARAAILIHQRLAHPDWQGN